MTVAIVAEYNPFHTGHKHQIDEIRRTFGENTEIIAIMSGNYTQRGEIAIADKFKRAEWACLSGVDLVLELPFPYSMSSAELFASAAVGIISSLSIVDYISFGSESGDLSELTKTAENMLTPAFSESFEQVSNDEKNQNLGYPAICELAYRRAFSEDIPEDYFKPNNILALEYIKAIKKQNAKLLLHTVKRAGAGYSELNVNLSYASAMGIRESLKTDSKEYISFIPEACRDSFLSALQNKEFPSSEDKLSSAILSFFRLNSATSDTEIFDAGGGLYNRIKKAGFDADSVSSLIAKSTTKKFTNSRIRRSVYYSFFGVTSSSVKELPEFTQVLAFNEKGRALLKSIKKRSGYSVLTKPTAADGLSERAKMQKKLSDKADSVYQLTLPVFRRGAYDLLAKPYFKR